MQKIISKTGNQKFSYSLNAKKWTWVLLITSSATLLCCALPLLLVGLGFGAGIASLFSSMPFLVVLGLYKAWTFGIAGFALIIAAWLLFRPGRKCPADSLLAIACAKAHYWNIRIFWVALLLWIIGFLSAYLLPYK